MGLFITVEGIDGAGKSTQVELLRTFLENRGREVITTREPGGTGPGDQIREMLLHGEDLSPWTEASLFAAARAELVARVIRPALQSGQDVILDRYIDSSLAYQGYGRELPLDPLLSWNQYVTGDLTPHCTFLLALPAEDASVRLSGQLQLFPAGGGVGPPDRMEREAFWFRRRVDEGYRELVQMFPDRFIEIDASKSKRVIFETMRARVKALIKDERPQKAALQLIPCL
jgi:dTMP kinase